MSDYVWLTPLSQQFLEKDYLLPGQTVDERVTAICENAERILNKPGFAKRFQENFKKGWYSFSTPIWTNFGTDRGLPISCFGSYIGDSMESILSGVAEVGMMTKVGGGTSGLFQLRERGAEIKNNGKSFGSVHFMQMYDKTMNIISQGSTRRGNFAAYLDIDHPDFDEFMKIRSVGFAIQDLNFGVCVSDDFMERMVSGDAEARRRWAKVLMVRAETGYPYIFFTDNANKGAADVYRKLKLKILHSNLCTEIMLPDNEEESFVCDLSSMNVLYYDEWKNTDAVELMVYFLDSVMSEFIEKASKIKFMERAVRFAQRHRALGIGWIGWHSLLQSKMIPMESDDARMLNFQIAETVHINAYAASEKMVAEGYEAPEICRLAGIDRRNTTLLAQAPTKSSAFIIGNVSEGVEPERANIQVKDLAKGKFTLRNKYLEALLVAKDANTSEVWDSILMNKGSVQHLGFLSEQEKAVFKTFREINPYEIIQQAADRQMFIDQGQSINLLISPSVSVKEVNALYIEAWRLGLKSLYYQFSVNAAQEFSRQLNNCIACEA